VRTPLACAVAVAVVWYLVFVPMRAEIEALQTRVANAEAEIRSANAAVLTLPVLAREVRKLESQFESLHATVTTSLDVNSVVADLQSAAADSHLRITALKPRNDSAQPKGMGQTVELGVEGTFHGIGRFLARLAASARVMTSSDVSVRARTSGRAGDGNVVGSILVLAFGFSADRSAPDALAAYDEGGRRDPFASLLAPETSQPAVTAANRGPGLAGTPVSDVVVRGVTRDGNRMSAILETSGRQSFVVRALDRLGDSIVRDINPSGVFFVQRDGRGGEVQVHKPIRPSTVGRP
jgi:Tfp pilus assembly protein PilO